MNYVGARDYGGTVGRVGGGLKNRAKVQLLLMRGGAEQLETVLSRDEKVTSGKENKLR